MSDLLANAARPLSGQVAVVTGAARGIGREIAITCARAGASVVVNYLHSQRAAEQVVALCCAAGGGAIAVQADVTVPAQVEHLFTQATALGMPCILVNNAGVSSVGLLQELPLAEWQRVVQTNLTAPFLCTQAALPYMMRAQYGRIVNLSSIWGLVGSACEVAYSATKGGLISFTRALAKEVAAHGITVNAIAPGAIDTDMISALSAAERSAIVSQTPVGRLGQPADVATSVLFLISPSASFITGQVISPNGGLVV